MAKSATPPRLRFTAEEDAIILSKPHAECIKLLPHRKPDVISGRKYRLLHVLPYRKNNNGEKGPPFTETEIAALREHYPHLDNKSLCAKFFPDRSTESIAHKARKLGLRKTFTPAMVADPIKEIVHQVLVEARNCGLSALNLDLICGSNSYFEKNWRRDREALNLTAVAQAAQILGGRLLIDFSHRPAASAKDRIIHAIAQYQARTAPAKPVGKPLSRWKKTKLPKPSQPAISMRPDAIMVREIESMVPRGTPGRDDVCQAILLALLEGRISKETLRGGRNVVTGIIRAVMKENFESRGYARSLDQPLRDGRQLYDVLPGSDGRDSEIEDAEAA